MQNPVFAMEHIVAMVKPLADKYRKKFIYSVRMREVKRTKIAIWIFWFLVEKSLNER